MYPVVHQGPIIHAPTRLPEAPSLTSPTARPPIRPPTFEGELRGSQGMEV